jgi:hypothetical protein
VVAVVAPPQLPAGVVASEVAASKFPVTGLQLLSGSKGVAVEARIQVLDCARVLVENKVQKKKRTINILKGEDAFINWIFAFQGIGITYGLYLV